jgi:type II restriction enzyme
MELSLDSQLAVAYRSPTQRVRILSEYWISQHLYCPNCGRDNVMRYSNNSRIADFYCAQSLSGNISSRGIAF